MSNFPFRFFARFLVCLIVVISTTISIRNQHSLPFFAPIIFIISLIVVSCAAHGNIEEVRITQDGIG